MTLEDVRSRPEFETVTLEIDPEEAHQRLSDAVKGLKVAETGSGRKYRTTDGMLVAIVAPPEDEDGDEAGATLAYRTEPAVELATRKAANVRAALESEAAGG
ncbi:MAG: hypothetical protein ABEJ31_09330 [Haloarculaceae archaeon]